MPEPSAPETPDLTAPDTPRGGSPRTGADTGVPQPADDSAPADNFDDAYAGFTGAVNPNASQEDMEAAINQYFGNVPGFEGAYKESVKINGVWYDLVSGYGGANASFQVLPKTGVKGSMGAGLFPEGSIGLPAIDDTSRLDQILASIDAMARGEGSPLVSQSIDELLGQASGGTPQAMTPMVDQTPFAAPRGRRQLPPELQGI